jgi:hypothetical protein
LAGTKVLDTGLKNKSRRGLRFLVTGDNRSNTERDSQTKFDFQTEKYLNILKIRFRGEGSESDK